MTPNLVSKATAPLPILSLACEAAVRLGASGVLIMPEGPMEWELVRSVCAGGVAIFVASSSPRQVEAIRKLGLQAIEVEPTEAAIAERITLALIEAVANDHLKAGARVVVAYSGFEAEALDSLTVIRLGEHLERLTARDLRALETWVPFETLKAVVDTAVEIGREGREGKAVGTLIVVGDVRNVLPRTRPLGFDPFKGYRRKERKRSRPSRPRGDQGDRPDGWGVCRGPRRHGRGRLPADRRADDWPERTQGPGHAALGRRRNHGRDQGPGRSRQPVQRHCPAVPGRRGHPPDRAHAACPCHEMA